MTAVTPLTAAEAKSGFDALFNAALDRHEEGNNDEALAILQALSIVNPLDEDIWEALACCHTARGEVGVASLLRAIGAQLREAVMS